MRIDLQDGFYNDTVVIVVNGKEVFRRTDVSTRFQIGYALSVDQGIAENSPVVEIILPLKNLSETIKLRTPEPVFLGVSLTQDGKIDCRISHEPFRYI